MSNLKKIIKILIKTSKFAIQYSPKYFFTLIFSCIALAIGFVWQADTQTKFFDSAIEFTKDNSGIQIIISFAIFVFSYIVTQVMVYLSNGVEEILEFRLQKQLSKKISVKASNINPLYYEDSNFLELLSKAKNGKNALVSTTLCSLSLLCYYIPYFLLMAYWLYEQSPILIIIIPIAFIPAVISYLVQIKVFIEHEDSVVQDKRRLITYEDSMIGKNFIKETRILGCFHYFMYLYTEVLNNVTKKEYTLRNRRRNLNLILKTVQVFGFVMVLIFTLVFVINHTISVSVFAAIFSSIDLLFSNIDEAISRQFATITEEFGSVYYYDRFMNEIQYSNTYNDNLMISEIKNVSFRYPNCDKTTLNNISLKIIPGQRIAIVGENGAGKTTLSKLLLGIYEPTVGDIVNTINIPNGKSVVFQNYNKYALSLENNITISDNDKIDKDRLNKSVEQSSILELIGKLDDGMNTLLGKEFGGVDLSGGEWQRVAIGRGVYKNSDYMVFDEPTSAIDPIEESNMYEKIKSITEGKTAIIVTHRMASIKFVDRILVMKEGTIVQDGSHQELLMLDGEYAKLYQMQRENYISESNLGSIC